MTLVWQAQAVYSAEYEVKLYSGVHLYLFLGRGSKPELTVQDLRRDVSKPFHTPFEAVSSVNGKKFTVAKCVDIMDLANYQSEPTDPANRGAYSNLALQCLAARVMLNAKPGRESHIDSIPLDKNIAKFLPASVAYRLTDREPPPGGKNWPQAEGGLQYVKTSWGDLMYSSKLAAHIVDIIGEGDVDGDGVQDLVIRILHGVHQGTHFTDHLYILTRHKPEGLLVVRKSYTIYP